ncbi:MAG TPA: hypothetical protein VFF00_10930, partial [Candidatus Elarobacter sp.]|nr:hypothetical protein [Candidatus Elarobacter sp.]
MRPRPASGRWALAAWCLVAALAFAVPSARGQTPAPARPGVLQPGRAQTPLPIMIGPTVSPLTLSFLRCTHGVKTTDARVLRCLVAAGLPNASDLVAPVQRCTVTPESSRTLRLALYSPLCLDKVFARLPFPTVPPRPTPTP